MGMMTRLSLLVAALSSVACAGTTDFDVGEPDPTVDSGSAETAEVGVIHDSGVDASETSEVAPPDSGLVPDSAPPPPDVAPTQKRVFVTSESYATDLGGLVGADARCQKLADAAKLAGTYKAWLSDSTTSAKTRLSHAAVPYRLVDGTFVAANWDELATNSHSHAIDRTEVGSKPTPTADGNCAVGATCVYTNSGGDGMRVASFSCANWSSVASTSAGDSLYVGRSDKSDGQWTIAFGTLYCAGMRASLYCVEQ